VLKCRKYDVTWVIVLAWSLHFDLFVSELAATYQSVLR